MDEAGAPSTDARVQQQQQQQHASMPAEGAENPPHSRARARPPYFHKQCVKLLKTENEFSESKRGVTPCHGALDEKP